MKQTADAMGRRDGDYLEMHNQWARVVVMRDHYQKGDRGAVQYLVSGESECSREPFAKIGDAMAHALAVLALYEKGRCD